MNNFQKKIQARVQEIEKEIKINSAPKNSEDLLQSLESISKDLSLDEKLEEIEKKIFPALAQWNSQKAELFLKDRVKNALDIKGMKPFIDRFNIFRANWLKQEPKNEPHKKVAMTADERAEALAYLQDPMLMENIVKDIDTCGYKQDDEKKLIQYLAATSRKLEKPIDTIIKSPSSSGKSYLVEVISKMMPPEDLKIIGGASMKALQHMDEGSLQGKWVIFLEVEGMWDLQKDMRLIQDGGFDYYYTAKDEDTGEFKTVQKRINGPLALTTTTTRAHIHDENETRMWELSIDTSEEKIESSHAAHAVTTTRKYLENMQPEVERIQKLHQNAQCLLEPILIINELNPLIKFPTTTLRSQRDRRRFTSLMEVVALIRQYQKEKKHSDKLGRDFIEVDLEDYAIAYELSKVILGSCAQSLSEKAQEVFYTIKKKVIQELGENASEKELENFTFTVKDVKTWTRLPKSSVGRYLDELEDEEYLSIEGGRKTKGKRTYYFLRQLSEVSQSYLTQITKPEVLRQLTEQKLPTSSEFTKGDGKVDKALGKPKDKLSHQVVTST